MTVLKEFLPKIWLLLAVFLVVSPAWAQGDAKSINPELLEKIRKSNAECFACHSEAGLKNPPLPGLDLAKLRETIRDDEVFKNSNHGKMECRQCHGQGYQAYPHAVGSKQLISPCEQCHAVQVMKAEMQFDNSVHAKNLKDKFTCSTCHDPHVALAAAKLGDPRKAAAQDNHMCLECHNSDLTFAKYAPADKKRPNIDKIHAWLPNTRLHWDAVRCVDCHTPVAKTLSHEIANKDKAERNCVTCHSTNTALATRLYRHVAKTEANTYGFANSALLNSIYVVGATRHPLLDWAMVGLVAATVAGVLGHGLVRIILAWRRNRSGR
ncbi:hypothetical protein A6A05_09185 [Magnetospirillum moscoviense]|uniref:Class III cytochrome C domain-containing protein n=1 Tax=Magnetospirillum moscoviense TaxID=1437059 RepID=A0A178MXC8_9PROT|nr:hypothetical protein A6A05_09185 [Magnetospirillum moscoviense]